MTVQTLLNDPAMAGSWTLAPERSSVRFISKTLWGLIPVNGRFGDVSGEARITPDGQLSGRLLIRADSVRTGIGMRDRHLRAADFFDAATNAVGFDPQHPGRTYDAILLDIDHSPRHVLHAPHAGFYTEQGLRSASSRLAPGGVFAMWSDDPPDEEFVSLLGTVFTDVVAESVWFDNPITRGRSAATIYLATRDANRR